MHSTHSTTRIRLVALAINASVSDLFDYMRSFLLLNQSAS